MPEEVIRHPSDGALSQHKYDPNVTDNGYRHEGISEICAHCSRSFQRFEITCRREEKGISGYNHYFPYAGSKNRKTHEPIQTCLIIDHARHFHLRVLQSQIQQICCPIAEFYIYCPLNSYDVHHNSGASRGFKKNTEDGMIK